MKYSKEKIVKALLLAPLPLLFFTALLFIIMNREYSLYSIFVVFAGHGLVYLAYSILTVPFSFMVSILLNRYSILNLLTICISSLIIAMPFFVLFGWSHTGEVSKEWWKMYTDTWTIFMALIPGLSYWLFLTDFKVKELLNKKIIYFNILAFVLTYLSLFHQKYTLIDRIVVDKLGKVEVIGGGFPLQFLVDGEISPGGSIALDPLNIIIGIDQFIFLYFILDYLFWLMCLLVSYAFFRKIKVKL
ncbi:TPA: hypothetical protein LUC71_003564 [Acinetobacter baumannii]|nr:hypothetical protein [Acinetobacter baumannii]HBM1136794.1 hypothetical protein [Acinetobacter baumannii]